MKKGTIETKSLVMHKTTNSLTQKRSKINQNTIKTVQVNLDAQSHRKLNSCSTSTKKMIGIPNNNSIPATLRKEIKRKTEYSHNKSNSIKEDIRKRNCRSLVKPKVYKTPQRLTNNNKQKQYQYHASNFQANCGNSNDVLTTNFTDNKEEKERKKEISDSTLNSLKHLQSIFRTSNLKQTIILDEKGTSNLLQMNSNHNYIAPKKANSRRAFCESLKGYIPPISHYTSNINKMSKYNNNKQMDDIKLKIDNNNTTINNNMTTSNNIQSFEEKDNNKAIDYDLLKNLLNLDVNQDNSGLLVLDYKDNKLFCDSDKDIFTKKEKEEIDAIELLNNTQEHIDNISFLDSCIKEELFDSFIKCDSEEKQHNLNANNTSFMSSTLLANKNDTNNLHTNYDQTECDNNENQDIQINLNIQPYLLNPRLLLKCNQFKIPKRYNAKEAQKECCIY